MRGRLENKGLNIFNSALVLASPRDGDRQRLRAHRIGHRPRVFHNWTGNRVTCRDWFQLCLKEGLTVFRDQEFTRDLRSAPVKRIEDANLMRARQFREGRRPARPSGAARKLRRDQQFLHDHRLREGRGGGRNAETACGGRRVAQGFATLYFDRHDGQAVTIEDWLAVFEEVTARDLSQFRRWYSQAGTPRVAVSEAWDGTHLTPHLPPVHAADAGPAPTRRRW